MSSTAATNIIGRPTRGAIFVPNVGDTLGGCPDTDLAGRPLSNDELSRCHDASGDGLLSSRYAAPLLMHPNPGPFRRRDRHIFSEPAHTPDRIRLFWKSRNTRTDAAEWALIHRQLSFNATSLRQGISLAFDGRELVTDAAVWDGSVKVVFEVTGGSYTARDSVALKQ
ncbi:hypothetical protein VTK56DRAFT_2072 [Thermocarpiscus australiensis]